MSFGFGIGDFLAIGKLSIHPWRSIKDAPEEFGEIFRELASINVVITEINDQAGSSTSLLNLRGVSRKADLLALRNNLMSTLEELQAVHQRYRTMGRNAWLRVQLGEQDLAVLSSKLTLHLVAIEGFMSSLTMASVGRIEPMMIEALTILRNTPRGYGVGAGSILDAHQADTGSES